MEAIYLVVYHLLSANHPPMVTVTTNIGQNRGLLNLAKIYINNVKYSSYNNNFTFKLSIFYKIYFMVDLLFEAKIKKFFIMFKDSALDKYLPNIGISSTVMNFNQVRYSIKKK